MRCGDLNAPGARASPDPGEQVVEYHAGSVLPARIAIEEPSRRRLEHVEEAEEDEAGDGREGGAGKEEHGHEITGHFVDDDVPGIRHAEGAACSLRGGDPGERHGDGGEDV